VVATPAASTRGAFWQTLVLLLAIFKQWMQRGCHQLILPGFRSFLTSCVPGSHHSQASAAMDPDVTAKLRELKQLRDEGVIDQEEVSCWLVVSDGPIRSPVTTVGHRAQL
jgi:hypothetical protein